jgi:hypothetical protein
MGSTGAAGATGAAGSAGAVGATGPGVATGGTTGQVLTKNSATNYDTSWSTVSSGGMTMTDFKTSSYTAASNEVVLCNATNGGFNVALPASPANNDRVTVKKIDGTNNIVTISNHGEYNQYTKLLSSDQAITFQYSSAVGWRSVGDRTVAPMAYGPTYVTGRWYDNRPHGYNNISYGALTAGVVTYIPFWMPRTGTIDQLCVATSNSVTSYSWTFAISTMDTNTGMPGAVLGSTTTTLSTNGFNAFSLGSTFVPIGWNWFAINSFNGNGPNLGLHPLGTYEWPIGLASGSTPSTVGTGSYLTGSASSTSIPSNPPANSLGTVTSFAVPIIWFRQSA